MEVRSKRMNFRSIYSKAVKYGHAIPELAKEYEMDEKEFTERLEKGLDPKLFAKVLKANEVNLRNNEQQKGTDSEQQGKEQQVTVTVTEATQEEELDMAKRKSDTSDMMSVLESKKIAVTGKISEEEKALEEASKILEIRENKVSETQKVFDKAKAVLSDAKKERDETKKTVRQYTRSIDKMKATLNDLESQIIDLKNKTIYLVAPGYTGKKPEFGSFYSTTAVEGFESLSVVQAEDYVIEPEFKDMVIAGYDSIKEYMEGLRFVMLCLEYACNDTDYTVLVDDERLKKLLKAHVE